MTSASDQSPILEVKNLKVHFPVISGIWRRTKGYVRAVDDLSFDLMEGETLGLVGESGCGKTTAGRAILRAVEPTSGEMWFRMPDGSRVSTTSAGSEELRLLRQDIQLCLLYTSPSPRD